MALPPLEDEEGVRPLTHPQRVGDQHLLGGDPHVGTLRSQCSVCVCEGVSKAELALV